MRRLFSLGVILGLVAPVGFVGCAEEVSTTQTEKVKTPGGTTETTVEKTIKSTGDNPPANSEGQKVEPPK